MACCPFTCGQIVNHHNHNHNRAPPPIYSGAATATSRMTSCFSSYSYSSFKLNRRNSFPSNRNSWSGRCHGASPQSEPPTEKHLSPISELLTTGPKSRLRLQYVHTLSASTEHMSPKCRSGAGSLVMIER